MFDPFVLLAVKLLGKTGNPALNIFVAKARLRSEAVKRLSEDTMADEIANATRHSRFMPCHTGIFWSIMRWHGTRAVPDFRQFVVRQSLPGQFLAAWKGRANEHLHRCQPTSLDSRFTFEQLGRWNPSATLSRISMWLCSI
jgi:hypothetical protein